MDSKECYVFVMKSEDEAADSLAEVKSEVPEIQQEDSLTEIKSEAAETPREVNLLTEFRSEAAVTPQEHFIREVELPSVETVQEYLFADTEDTQEEDMLPEDPLAPCLRTQTLDSQAKLMLLNVIKYFHKIRLARAEETGEDMNVNKVVAEAAGVSPCAVRELLTKYREGGVEKAIGPIGTLNKTTNSKKRKAHKVVKIKEGAPPKIVQKKPRKK